VRRKPAQARSPVRAQTGTDGCSTGVRAGSPTTPGVQPYRGRDGTTAGVRNRTDASMPAPAIAPWGGSRSPALCPADRTAAAGAAGVHVAVGVGRLGLVCAILALGLSAALTRESVRAGATHTLLGKIAAAGFADPPDVSHRGGRTSAAHCGKTHSCGLGGPCSVRRPDEGALVNAGADVPSEILTRLRAVCLALPEMGLPARRRSGAGRGVAGR
jgi:hypothetical protein